MKKNTIEKIEKEIHEKTKLPQEIKSKIKKEVLVNILVGAFVILYFIFIVLGSIDTIKNVRIIDLNIFSILFLGTAILLFEIGYRRSNGELAIYGIESLIVAIFTLFLPYIIFELKEVNNRYYLVASICITFYYFIKSIIITVKIRNKYMKNISDVKEIVKKEKTKRRIKEDIEEEEEKVTKANKNNKKIDKEKVLNKEKKTSDNKNVSKKVKENKKEDEPKRRGRPKKTETKNNESKQNIGVDKQNDMKPKKRGRPRKVVVNND